MNFANVLSDAKIGNLTKGLVPDSVIKTFFYKDNGLQYPQMGRAQVKVPHLWGFKQKMKAGVFSSGEFSGENSSWAFGAELFASDSSEHLRAIEPKLNKFVDETLANLLPPPYPFEIKPLAVERGKDLFDLTCIKCHGDHQRDEKGYPVYTQPKFIKLSKVETDSDRANAVDPELRRLIQKSTGADLLLMNPEKEKGYLAPKLWGIWSRFPYLHNGSVPTIYHLMIKPKSRPQFFSMKKAGEKHRFDQNKLGLTLPVKNTKQFIKMQKKALNNYRSIYHIKRDGHSNSGHYFKFMDDFSEQDRMDIIEYLKTL
jgi:hypothetical protein